MVAKLSEGDTVGLTARSSCIDDGAVTIRPHGFDYPITLRGEHLSLIAKRRSKRRPAYDEH